MIRKKTKMPIFTTAIQYFWPEQLDKTNGVKRHPNEKGRSKPISQITCIYIFYKESTINLPAVTTNTLSKSAGHKVNRQKSGEFLYNSNENP